MIGLGLVSANIIATEGVGAFVRDLVRLLRKFPGVNKLLNVVLNHEVKGALKMLTVGKKAENSGAIEQKDGSKASKEPLCIPEKGVAPADVLKIMHFLHQNETHAEEGKAFAYTYTTTKDMADFANVLSTAYAKFAEKSNSGKQSHEDMLAEVWKNFMHTNALNPMLYSSLRKFETEVVSMSCSMMHGDINTTGSLTSGGTESCLMAIKAYRDRARKLCPHIQKPNMIAGITIHPAFEKAAHYFDVTIIHVPTTANYRVDVAAVERAINADTILLIGSAPQYAHGVIDPIEELSALALKKGLPLHVDACFGGFMLPWLEKLGEKIPRWDFRVEGVTSISADIHKYGYSSKGASVILYRNEELRSYQYFAYSEWPGGLFASPSMAGSRPGGMIAAAWAAMVCMGQDGYMKIAKDILDTTKKVKAAVEKIEGIKILAPSDSSAIAIGSDDPNISILAVADQMEENGGWKIERNQNPDSLHMSILPQHSRVVDQLIVDLEDAVKRVRANPSLKNKGTTGVYGMVATIPDKGIVDDFLLKFFSTLFTPEGGADTSIIATWKKSEVAKGAINQ